MCLDLKELPNIAAYADPLGVSRCSCVEHNVGKVRVGAKLVPAVHHGTSGVAVRGAVAAEYTEARASSKFFI